MRTRDGLGIAMDATRRYPLRMALSVASVSLGVGAVVALVAVGAGARAQAMREVSLLGLSNIVVRYRSPSFAELYARRAPGLTAEDASRLIALDSIVRDSAILRTRSVTAAGPEGRVDTELLAVTSPFAGILGLSVQAGRLLSPLDDAVGHQVCLIGPGLRNSLFGAAAGLGAMVSMGERQCEVVGILSPQQDTGQQAGPISPRPFDRIVVAPLAHIVGRGEAANQRLRIDEIWIALHPDVDPSAAGGIIDRTLSASRPDGSDFEVLVPVELLRQRIRLRRTFDLVTGAVAVIALVVGAIGVMNVMLSSVLERTSEIGLRRSVGATRRAIAGQFLAETLVISILGGVVGLGLGVVTAWIISRAAGWPVVVSGEAALIALFLSSTVGVVAGLYPARHAAALDPIDALRAE